MEGPRATTKEISQKYTVKKLLKELNIKLDNINLMQKKGRIEGKRHNLYRKFKSGTFKSNYINNNIKC